VRAAGPLDWGNFKFYHPIIPIGKNVLWFGVVEINRCFPTIRFVQQLIADLRLEETRMHIAIPLSPSTNSVFITIVEGK
jgi:hypothetical protein